MCYFFFFGGGGEGCLYNILKILGFHIVLDFGGQFCCCFGFFFNKNPLEYIANKLPAVVEWYMYAYNR